MQRSVLFALSCLSLGGAIAFAACSNDETIPGDVTTTSAHGGAGGSAGSGGSGADPSALCQALGLPVLPFAPGPYGIHRGEVADDFTLELADGQSFALGAHFAGCESYLFIPDRIPVSDADATSIWEKDADLARLVADSPRNTHYFFVSRQTTDEAAAPVVAAQQARVDALLASFTPDDAAHWRERLHVVAKRAGALGNWVGDVLGGHGRLGFAIDRAQRVRGAGSLADVTRFRTALSNAGLWPWESNLAYAANEPQYFDAEALLAARLAAENATVVKLWDGEVLQEYADTTVTLPTPAEMANFDTLEVEVTQQCPDPNDIELGNCGAWDYIASLAMEDAAFTTQVEIARFITSYHRETHWVVDISAMLPLLAAGGSQAFRWSFAPSWNVQPTATRLALRFSHQNKATRPVSATFLWSGGAFDSAYNANHAPVDVPIAATTQKVELWTLLTGHGSGTNQCAEFCNHQHDFSVNGVAHREQFPGASTNGGCIPELANGMTPNQAGTWWFGRGGWCPGQQVDPFVVDVTADVTPGATATLSYEGLFANVAPPPDGSGDIDLVSYLVQYE